MKYEESDIESAKASRMSKNHINESYLQADFLNLLHPKTGHFKLESGHHGNLWLDLDLLFLRPKAIQPFVTELARKIAFFSVDAICGPMVGGALVAQSIALELGVDFLYTERMAPQNPDTLYSAIYILPYHLRTVANNQKVAIVDDVINAGSAVRGTLAELESVGARPIAIGALLVLGETGQTYFAERDLPLRYISHLPNEIWTPEDCPLCSSQIPLND
jgi:orotate phosphoribosyltransferase